MLHSLLGERVAITVVGARIHHLLIMMSRHLWFLRHVSALIVLHETSERPALSISVCRRRRHRLRIGSLWSSRALVRRGRVGGGIFHWIRWLRVILALKWTDARLLFLLGAIWRKLEATTFFLGICLLGYSCRFCNFTLNIDWCCGRLPILDVASILRRGNRFVLIDRHQFGLCWEVRLLVSMLSHNT